MVRLGIDSATDRLSVALEHPDGRVVETTLAGARQHTRNLLGLIDDLLRRLSARRDQLGAVAVSDGPGSFTGLRVAATVAKALVALDQIPLYTASTLLVRVRGLLADPGVPVLSVASALRGELYVGMWRNDPAGWIECLHAPTAARPEALELPVSPGVVIGDGPNEVIDALRARWPVTYVGPPDASPRAADLLRLIGVVGGAAQVSDPEGWEPNYGRPAEAQARWEEAHGRPLPDPASHRN